MFSRTKSNGKRTYLQLVERKRAGSKVRQQVVDTLDRLLGSDTRLSEYAAVLSAHDKARQGHPDRTASRVIGPALVFKRLGRITDCCHAVCHRRFRFDFERAVFLTVLHRLCAPGSDRSALRWAGIGALQLHHLYRAMASSANPCPCRRTRPPTRPARRTRPRKGLRKLG